MSAIFYAAALFLSASPINVPAPPPQQIDHVMDDLSFLRALLNKYPELNWLAQDGVRKTEEGVAINQNSYSQQLFGKQYVEFDRSVSALKNFYSVLDGSFEAYSFFVKNQSKEARLSIESFEQIHRNLKAFLLSKWGDLSERELIELIEVALILGDSGKSEWARAHFKPYGPSAADHDHFYWEMVQVLNNHPDLSPSFAKLSNKGRLLLLKTAKSPHFGHIAHAECGPNGYRLSKELGPLELQFLLHVHRFDVCGALGHVKKEGSLVYTENTHLTMELVSRTILSQFCSSISLEDIYKNYLVERAKQFGFESLSTPIDSVLARIGAMLRLFKTEEGDILKRALLNLSDSDRSLIISEWDLTDGAKEFDETPTYIPAVLVNLANNPLLGESREERLAQAVAIGLPAIAKVLKRHRIALHEGKSNSSIPLNFNPVAAIAKNAPFTLLNGEFEIDTEGGVHYRPTHLEAP